MQKYATTISEGTIAKSFIKTRLEVHESLLCVNKRNSTASSSRKKQYQTVTPLDYIMCTSIILPLLSLYLRRV